MTQIKLVLLCGLLPLLCSMYNVVYYGRAYRMSRDRLMLDHHRAGANGALCYLVLAVLLVESAVRIIPHAGYPALMWVHLPLAFVFAGLLLLLRFGLTGIRSASHRPLAYLCLVAFAGAFGTGAALLWQL